MIRFVGGKGGVGKTTIAAAYALGVASPSHRTLLVSTDPAHSLADVLATGLGDEPRTVAPGRWAAEIDGEAQAARRVEQVVADAERAVPREVMPAVRAHLRRAVQSPGTVESALLDRLTDLVEQVGTTWDTVVVDSAPTGHMLRLLALPTLMTPWIEGLVAQRETARRADRMAAGMLGRPDEPDDPLLARLRSRRTRLEAMAARLRNEACVHLVMVPELLPLAETRRAAATVREAGLPLGRVVVNRVVPDHETGLLARRRAQQDTVLASVADDLDPPGTVLVPLLPGSLTGTGGLRELTDLLRAARLDDH